MIGDCTTCNGETDVQDMRISRREYWAVQRYLRQNNGCPRCGGCIAGPPGSVPCRCPRGVSGVPNFLRPVARSGFVGQSTTVNTTTSPAATSTGTVVTIGVVAVAAGAGLAYLITRHHDQRRTR